MKPFRERNPVPLGIGGLITVLVLLLIAFRANELPFLGDDATFHAVFPEAAGIAPENEVRVAGVRVGTVEEVRLKDRTVVVTFRASNSVRLGEETRAAIKIKTLLGTKFLELQPAGAGRLTDGATIPISRTTVPFEIYQAFDDLTGTVDMIDVDQLSAAFRTLSDTFRDNGGNSRAALQGLQRVSHAIASRDSELRRLISSTRTVTGALAERDVELTRLLGDADLVFAMVKQRREVIASLLRSTSRLAQELTSLVRDNRKVIDPLLRNLHSVLDVLRVNLASLDKSVTLLGPFARYGANSVGNGRWLDVYAENFIVSEETLKCLDDPASCR